MLMVLLYPRVQGKFKSHIELVYYLKYPLYRVFTVFSTSKDHRQGEAAMAGCILVDNEKIQVINRSPKYKNKYVHRRTSTSLEHLTPKEVREYVHLSSCSDQYYCMIVGRKTKNRISTI